MEIKWKVKTFFKVWTVIFSGFFATSVFSQDIGDDYMSGNYRQKLADRGVGFEFVYTGDFGYNVLGGLKQDRVYVHNIDITLDMDMETLVGWKGGEIFLYALHGFGNSPTALVGDWQATSNIEAGMDYIKLYEAWIQQSFFGGAVSLLFGLHDLNSEFYVNDPAGLFLNSSMGVGADLSQSAGHLNGPSIFPTAAPAVRLSINPTDNLYIMAGLYNARAGNPADPTVTDADFTFKDGFLYIGELGYYAEGDIKIAAGGWSYSDPIPELKTGKDATPYGAYVLFDKTLGSIFSVFVRGGLANADTYEIAYNIMEGFTISGAAWGREDDQLGFGASTIIASSAYSNVIKGLGGKSDTAETAIELTYLIQFTPWFSLQPNAQYVVNPGLEPSVDDALILTIRASISF